MGEYNKSNWDAKSVKLSNHSMIKLEILTHDKNFAAVCQLYWEVDNEFEFVHKVSELAETAQVDKKKLPSLVKESCNAYVPTWECEDCRKPYIFSSRSDLTSNKKYLLLPVPEKVSYVCSNCRTQRKEKEVEVKRRKAEEDKRSREIIEQEKRKKIREIYDLSNREPVDIGLLSLTDIVYLLSLMRAGAYENLSKIIPVAMFEQPLSPTKEFTSEIINYVHGKGLIYVHPDTEPEGFVDDDVERFYIWHVYYAPPISKNSPDNQTGLFSELLSRINAPWTQDWCEEALQLWKRVALEESKEYLLFVLNEHHFEFSPGEKTNQYLEFALQHFSTSQVFNTIWRAAKDAAAYYQREGISKKQAANSAIASIQRISERAMAERWEIKPFGRNFKCPQTMISEVLYNSALKLSDEGFTSIPNIEIIKMKKLEK
jgi:hypothetical protein